MAFVDLLPDTQVTSIAVEMGTLPPEQVLRSVTGDNWLHLRGEIDSETGRAIKQAIRDAFFPDEPAWKDPAYARSMEIMDEAVKGLSES
jgi:hypothetical protein